MTEKISGESYSSDFNKGLKALEDIQLLSEFSISPLVSNAYYYLSEMKRKADLQIKCPINQFEAVCSVLDEKLKNIIEDFFGNKSRFKGFDYCKSVEDIDLKKWNLVLENIPEILSVVGLFSYHGRVEIFFDKNRLEVNGLILEDGRFELNRKLLYIITRKLLRNKILLTFNSESSERTGLFKLSLKADFSHDESLQYRVNFNVDSVNYIIGFSNVFMKYRVDHNALKEIGMHTVVQIFEDLSVHHQVGILELSDREYESKEILHFPFLFRPLSIILPIRGHLSSATFSTNMDDENKRKQDVSKQFRTIDFFSLFSL